MTVPPWLLHLWQQISHTQHAAPTHVRLATLLIAALLIIPQPIWRITRNIITVAHEGAHALIAVCCGRRLNGIKLHADTSGTTRHSGRGRGVGTFLTSAAGYPGPAVLGLTFAIGLRSLHVAAVLLSSFLALALMFALIRNLYGALVVAVAGTALYTTLMYTADGVQAWVAYTLMWFLVLGAPRAVWELRLSRRGGHGRDSDADHLGEHTKLPGSVWVGVFALLTVGVLGQTVRMVLLGRHGLTL